ncbi:MAG: DUF3500 domain-containing protein [Verrucomicrobiota bacterium]
MKRHSLLVLTLVLFSSLVFAEPYPSLPSEVLSTYIPETGEAATAAEMSARAEHFLTLLDDSLLQQAALPFDSPEKSRWTNTPPRGPQGGVRLGDLNREQLQAACELLASVLSPQGYGKAINIPLADDRLLNNGQRRPGFGAEDYWMAIFGEPSPDSHWAIQLDGHHLAINLSILGDEMSLSPTFIGTQPRDFQQGAETIAPMESKDEGALKLMEMLSEEQREQALIGDTRSNLVAGAGRDGFVPEPIGLLCEQFDPDQRAALKDLIELYVGDLPDSAAEKRMKELESELDDMTFAWWGPVESGGDFSYRIQGPSLIIEYAGQDLGGDPHNHLHSIYRDPTNEYGARLGGS